MNKTPFSILILWVMIFVFGCVAFMLMVSEFQKEAKMDTSATWEAYQSTTNKWVVRSNVFVDVKERQENLASSFSTNLTNGKPITIEFIHTTINSRSFDDMAALGHYHFTAKEVCDAMKAAVLKKYPKANVDSGLALMGDAHSIWISDRDTNFVWFDLEGVVSK